MNKINSPAVVRTRTLIPRTSALWPSQYTDRIMSVTVYPVTCFGLKFLSMKFSEYYVVFGRTATIVL